jgi:hypothetical protein
VLKSAAKVGKVKVDIRRLQAPRADCMRREAGERLGGASVGKHPHCAHSRDLDQVLIVQIRACIRIQKADYGRRLFRTRRRARYRDDLCETDTSGAIWRLLARSVCGLIAA